MEANHRKTQKLFSDETYHASVEVKISSPLRKSMSRDTRKRVLFLLNEAADLLYEGSMELYEKAKADSQDNLQPLGELEESPNPSPVKPAGRGKK